MDGFSAVRYTEKVNYQKIVTTLFENRITDYAKGSLKGNWSDVWGAKK